MNPSLLILPQAAASTEAMTLPSGTPGSLPGCHAATGFDLLLNCAATAETDVVKSLPLIGGTEPEDPATELPNDAAAFISLVPIPPILIEPEGVAAESHASLRMATGVSGVVFAAPNMEATASKPDPAANVIRQVLDPRAVAVQSGLVPPTDSLVPIAETPKEPPFPGSPIARPIVRMEAPESMTTVLPDPPLPHGAASGISVAKVAVPMEKILNPNENAAGPQQILPDASQSAPPFAWRPTTGQGGMEKPATWSSSEPQAPAVGFAVLDSKEPGFEMTPPARAAREPITPIQHTAEILSNEVRQFKWAGRDAVDVVLAPDSKTQIALHLHWHAGQVEVLAECRQGDFASLNLQWPELQSALAQHGVRLASLTEPPAGSASTGGSPDPDRRGQAKADETAEPRDWRSESSHAARSSSQNTHPARNGSARLLESWA